MSKNLRIFGFILGIFSCDISVAQLTLLSSQKIKGAPALGRVAVNARSSYLVISNLAVSNPGVTLQIFDSPQNGIKKSIALPYAPIAMTPVFTMQDPADPLIGYVNYLGDFKITQLNTTATAAKKQSACLRY